MRVRFAEEEKNWIFRFFGIFGKKLVFLKKKMDFQNFLDFSVKYFGFLGEMFWIYPWKFLCFSIIVLDFLVKLVEFLGESFIFLCEFLFVFLGKLVFFFFNFFFFGISLWNSWIFQLSHRCVGHTAWAPEVPPAWSLGPEGPQTSSICILAAAKYIFVFSPPSSSPSPSAVECQPRNKRQILLVFRPPQFMLRVK